MDDMRLFRAVGEIDDDLLLDAEAAWERGKTRPVRFPAARWAALAACLLLVTTALCWPKPGGVQLPADGTSDGGNQSGGGAVLPAAPAGTVTLAFNDVAVEPLGKSISMFALMGEDFVPMTCDEALDYFGADLPVTEALPEMALTGGGCYGGGFGVYRTEERGDYYDVNTFSFSDAAGEKSLDISLRTTLIVGPGYQDIANGPEKIAFTRVNGWDLALFRYTGDGYTGDVGRVYCHTQFEQNGVVWDVTASGLTEEELARVLASILPEKPAQDGPRTASGTVTWVDDRAGDYFDGTEHHYTEGHDYIELTLDDGKTCAVWVPGEADRYAEGDRVAVTYTGEPATVGCLWPGQIESVECLAE